jgi:hypothetical protein
MKDLIISPERLDSLLMSVAMFVGLSSTATELACLATETIRVDDRTIGR